MASPLRASDGIGGTRRLATVIDRFGEAIEADLAALGHSLTWLWRKRRWRFLLNLIDHLPRNSHFVEALLNDEEFAEHLARMPEGNHGERFSDWSSEREALARVEDAVNALRVLFAAAHGDGNATFTPAPRPSSAVEEARHRHRHARHRALVARMLPNGPHGG